MSLTDGLSYLGAADVVERGVGNGYAFGRFEGFACCVEFVAWATVDDDRVGLQYLFPFVPFMEILPVVGADDEVECVLRIGFGEFGKGADGVGGYGECPLKVGYANACGALCCEAGYVQAFVVVEDVGVCRLLQRVERRNQKPHFIDNLLFYE